MKHIAIGLALSASCAMLAGCEGGDRYTYMASVDEMTKALLGKESHYASGSQTRSMKAIGTTADGLTVSLWNDVSWKTTCEIKLKPVAADQTRVIPSCGGKRALGLVEAEIVEHVKQILTGKPVDTAFIQAKTTANFAKAYPGMVGDALKMDHEMRVMRYNDEQARKRRAAGDIPQSERTDLSGDWGPGQ
jgi:hypothetical protein